MLKQIVVKLFYVILLMFGNLYDFSEDNNILVYDYCYENSIFEQEESVEIELISELNNILIRTEYINNQNSNIKKDRNFSIEIFKPPKLS